MGQIFNLTLPGITSLQRRWFHLEAELTGKPIVFDIHPNEFIDESDEKRVISKRSKNPLTWLLKDVLRSRLKVRNLGPGAAPLYEREMDFYLSRGCRFETVRGYCEKMGLVKTSGQ
jgi:peptidoglycan-N-acetylglucosamine deacetylase